MYKLKIFVVFFFLFSISIFGDSSQQFKVIVDLPENGNLKIAPAIPEDGMVEAGTELILSAKADKGYALDSIYYSVTKGKKRGLWYYESMTSPFKVKVTRDMSLGVSFIEKSSLSGFRVEQNIVYAKPGKKTLKYDAFIPEQAEKLPCIIIVHGGGWVSNTEDVMRGLARELVRSGEYVVFSVDYRWLNKMDGDEIPNSRVDLIEDVFGAVVHIQENAAKYGADPGRIVLTGDSAGGHLSASVANMANRVGPGGFGETEGVYEFKPSYLPQGKSLSEIRSALMNSIRGVAPSYGVFGGGNMLKAAKLGQSEEWLQNILPIYSIPDARKRKVPHYILRGTKDRIIKHEAVQKYVDALTAAGQRVEYIQLENVHHSFFDWKPNSKVKTTFNRIGVPYAARMKAFFDSILNEKKSIIE